MTPETDAAVIASNGQWSFVLKETCQRLERERDEAIRQRDETNTSSKYACDYNYEQKLKAERERDEAKELAQAFHNDQVTLLLERDEAREQWKQQNEALITLALHGDAEIQRLTKERDEARNKMADALQEIDLRTLDFERMKQERDEAREERDRYKRQWEESRTETVEAVK